MYRPTVSEAALSVTTGPDATRDTLNHRRTLTTHTPLLDRLKQLDGALCHLSNAAAARLLESPLPQPAAAHVWSVT